MLTGIKINNLRNLNFQNYIEINPLTILLGENSSGKSSFLRFFPLVRQSLETKRSVPLLWYGNLVDFGSFEETLKKNSINNEIKFAFEFKELGLEMHKIELSLKKENEIEYLNFIKLYTKEDKLEIEFNSKNEIILLSINNRKINESFKCYSSDPSSLIPDKMVKSNNRMNDISKLEKIYKKIESIFKISKIDEIADPLSNFNSFSKEETIMDFIKDFVRFILRDGKSFYKTNSKIFSELKRILKRGKVINTSNIIKYGALFIIFDEKIEFDEVADEMKELKNLLILYNLENILSSVNNIIFKNFHNISYIAPLRATAERYYRSQGLDINEISPNGSNLPMYFKSLSKDELKNFNEWIERNFDFKINLSNNGGHISLEINQNGEITNLTDTGFGFSQILPIVVQLWNKTTKERFGSSAFKIGNYENNKIFLIEQPELHLHPAMQAKLIDAILKSIKIAEKEKINMKFIIETHSETIVNRVGRHIIEDLFDKNQVNLLIFEKKNGELKILETQYNSNGELTKWPFGFFEPEGIKQ